MQGTHPPAPPDPGCSTTLARAEARGRQVLLYAPHGPLGGSFLCSRCGASALQPDLLMHADGCLYGTTLPAPAPGALP